MDGFVAEAGAGSEIPLDYESLGPWTVPGEKTLPSPEECRKMIEESFRKVFPSIHELLEASASSAEGHSESSESGSGTKSDR